MIFDSSSFPTFTGVETLHVYQSDWQGYLYTKKIYITGNKRENYTLLEHALKNVLFPKISSNT